MTNILREIIAGGVVLGVLVLVHEWGHFIVAKLCGVRVDVFSIGFGPRIWGWKKGDTDYRVSWLPLGGYVRMAGENPAEERTGAAYEFLSRPRWQRFLIAIAGPAANIVTAFLIFWGIYAFVGAPVDRSLNQPAVVAAVPQSAGAGGVQADDRIVEVNGAKTSTWEDVETKLEAVKPGGTFSLKVIRGGQEQTLKLSMPASASLADSVVGYPPQSTVIDEVTIGFPAERAGIKAGDKVIEMNGKPMVTWYQMLDGVHNSNGNPVELVVQRGGEKVPITVTPVKGMDLAGQSVWQIGVMDRVEETYARQGPIEAVRDALQATWHTTKMIGQVFSGLFQGKVSVKLLAGPLGIVRVSGQAAEQGPLRLLELTAAISLNLAFLNLMPIPILDGGHVLLLAIEGGMRRDLSIAFKERFVQVGLVFLLAVFAFIMYSDILK